ncbi:MAG: T9SS type A sorting domain-containing protein [Candidatus Eisenbacteria bacterium]|uniref:T9SS type A sorting domain-containing protein n=1 Tax=Eiseniibacteriota bacterium TaxID=2212470 RepID=A0A849SKD5_UNCEI|nr:T9SS type A sorting domain-containing protein [Candidatus Eisenbacteria bacterium]
MNSFYRFVSRASLVAVLAVSLAAVSNAATIVIVNNDGAGEGFNDATAAVPVGGNLGATVGQQRLNAFQYAANLWGSILPSAVPIQVRSQFNPQTCTATSAVLGSAGPLTTHANFAGAPVPGHWYHAALANSLAGTDLSAANPDINATFNSNLNGSPTCLGGTGWYYGFDGLEGANIELLPVLLHEMGHGLGFSTTTSGTSGNFSGGLPSIFDKFMIAAATGTHWDQMTAAQRVASGISLDGLAWDGPAAVAYASVFLGPRPSVVVSTPPGIAGTYNAGNASFGASLAIPVSGTVVLMEDGVAPINDGCEALVNGAALAGNIAIVDRGLCAFVLKAQAAQAAGAIGLIVVNNVAGPAPALGGVDPSITIPVLSLSQADGNLVKANLPGVTVTIGNHPTLKAGANNLGQPLMYVPNPFQSGSSVSHWDVSLFPNALMEPAINADLHDQVDLTRYLFEDIGWFPIPTATTLAQFVAVGRGDGIEIRWSFSDASQLSVVTLERATSSTGPWAPISTELTTERNGMVALDRNTQNDVEYSYRLHIIERDGTDSVMGYTSARRIGVPAGRVFLATPSPNPAPGATSIAFRLGQPEFVRLSIVDANGRKVRSLQNGMMEAGDHQARWDGRGDGGTESPVGVYFVTLRTSNGSTTQRFALVR